MSKQISIKKIKEDIREDIWITLEARGVARWPKPVFGRIPNFEGSEETCRKIVELEIFRKARVVKVNPDSPQALVRVYALLQGKTLIMPSPRLRHGFVVLDPSKIPREHIREAAYIRNFMDYGEKVDPWDLPEADLVVIGSVAVNEKGARVGKGGGFADLEYGVLREFKKISENTPVITNVHDLQVLEMDIPMERHDVPVDLIVTPTKMIKTQGVYKKPEGIYWDILQVEPEAREFIDKIKRYLRKL